MKSNIALIIGLGFMGLCGASLHIWHDAGLAVVCLMAGLFCTVLAGALA